MNLTSIEQNHQVIGAHVGAHVGAYVTGRGEVSFRLWAPLADRVELVLETPKSVLPMRKTERGYFEIKTREAASGTRYKFRLNGAHEFPDPASRFQPDGVHGASEVVGSDFNWNDQDWEGVPLHQLVIYELHIGTFTKEGTFRAAIEKLPYLKELGVNAIEIMPVAQFPGARNWGYDGVGLFAAQNSYGGPNELKALVDACHSHGIAAILDVVYNHLGPEGNYLSQFGKYFQLKYSTPWGAALNFDGDWSDEVRNYFLQNAKQWLDEFHFDGLRLDAVHAIFDTSAQPFLEDLTRLKNDLQKTLGRRLHLLAESDANDSRLLRSTQEGGIGMDGQWGDDLHHSIHALVTGERQGYYSDYGTLQQLTDAYQNGVIFDGEYSEFRHRSHGRSYKGIDRHRLVVCSQNHDQIGNRMLGERLKTLVGDQKQKLAAACVFLSPCMPLMFMGEEFGETAPFLYFVDHGDKDLIEAVRKGRREEFSSFRWQGEPPDPAASSTFEKSKLDWRLVQTPQAQKTLNYYKRLIEVSKWIRSERLLESDNCTAKLINNDRVVKLIGRSSSSTFVAFLSFSDVAEKVQVDPDLGALEMMLHSWDDSLSRDGNELMLQPFGAVALRGRRTDAR
jgi:maltooligosyltrehalose trehalohydrolase